MGRVVILDLHADDPCVDASVEEAILEGFEVDARDCRGAEEVIAAVRAADVVLFKACRLDRSILEQCRHLKGIVRYGIGLDKVDLQAAREFGIPVCNVPDASTAEVADHTMTLALACLRGLPSLRRQAATGQWRIPQGLVLEAPSRLLFGTVGFGRIARETLDRAAAFGFQLAAHDPFVEDAAMASRGVRPFALEELLAAADLLVVQCPHTPETHRFMNRERLRLMKPGAVLVNTARGELIDTTALVEALEAGKFLGVGLDVTDPEPLPSGHALYGFERVILTPHAAWYSESARRRVREGVAREALRLLRGEPPRNRAA